MIVLLIFKELWFRKFNFLLSALSIIIAVTLFVAFFTTSEGSKRETIRLTRDMGFNLRIVPKQTKMDAFWTTGFSNHTMPEAYVKRFMAHKNFSFAHLTATLQQHIEWRGVHVILTGISAEIEPSGRKKSSMSFQIQANEIYVGYDIARQLGIRKDDVISILGNKFNVKKTLTETGSDDDIRLYARLVDVQQALNMPEQINEIKALNCLCLTADGVDPLGVLREQLEQVLPDAKVIMNRTIAVARESQRMMLEKYFAFILPFIIIVCAVWIGAMAMINVKDRTQEIGVLRALGYSSNKIAALFIGKSIVLGIAGALIGFFVGNYLALSTGPDIFKVTAKAIKPIYGLLEWSLLAAPLFAAVSTFIPTMLAVTQDPARTLRED